ncbi:hypothetical protein KSP40_PGU004835 [Platanthera guangdongensis]|uniref:Ankyrin repeat protein n=1 Tax=Platanthera guangdongensis TaxID=2320717 RepID=A0ABR2LR97_9ASPA
MAVPARRNELDEHDEGDGGLFEDEEEAWADPDIDVPPHLRPLADAAKSGHVNALRVALVSSFLIGLIIIETISFPRDISPLHHAARGEHLNVVQLLLSMGASPLVTNISGKTPAELADPGTNARRVLDDAAAPYSMVSQ